MKLFFYSKSGSNLELIATVIKKNMTIVKKTKIQITCIKYLTLKNRCIALILINAAPNGIERLSI